MERIYMFEEKSEEWLVGPPEGTDPRCVTDVMPPGISSGSARTSEVRARDSESLFISF